MTAAPEVPAGRARSSGPSVQEVLARESLTQKIPAALRTEAPEFLGLADLPRERYWSKEFHDLEVAKMWTKVWQMACREEDIPEAGDTLVYDIAHESVVLARQPDGGVRAFHNSCLHRGTQFALGQANRTAFTCPFHSWSWHLDGSLKNVPCRWDFPQVDDDAFRLPEVRVGHWDGWIFVNLDQECGPLEDYLGEVLAEHFGQFPLAERFKAVHVAARVPANWKTTIEAFIEAYHLFVTHPEIVGVTGDHNTQYDVFDDHVSRMISLMGVPSPSLGDSVTEESVTEIFFGEFLGSDQVPVIPDGRTARDVIADAHRAGTAQASGVDVSGMSNTEAIDTIEYSVFPNLVPWACDGFPIVYRYRPDADDPESCIVDVMLMALHPPGAKPPGAPVHWLETRQGEMPDWSQAPELGFLGPVLNQDMENLKRQQRGLRAGRKRTVTLSAYQESRIRHLDRTLRKYLDAP